ncbi:MAG: hypothetical protein MR473_09415 [Clostridiales bacterium]|nr:hypothetical protein [Clostridiales bacterium]
MKPRFMKRIVSALLSATLLIGAAGSVLAGGDALPPREGEQGYLGENQPTYHGYRAYDVLNWSAETDEYSQFMRADVPLQARNEAFADTQANPLLTQEAQSLALMEDYGDEFFKPTPPPSPRARPPAPSASPWWTAAAMCCACPSWTLREPPWPAWITPGTSWTCTARTTRAVWSSEPWAQAGVW